MNPKSNKLKRFYQSVQRNHPTKTTDEVVASHTHEIATPRKLQYLTSLCAVALCGRAVLPPQKTSAAPFPSMRYVNLKRLRMRTLK